MNPLLNGIGQIKTYDMQNFLLSRKIAVSNCKKENLVMLVKALINLGPEGNVDFHEDPVPHCRSF